MQNFGVSDGTLQLVSFVKFYSHIGLTRLRICRDCPSPPPTFQHPSMYYTPFPPPSIISNPRPSLLSTSLIYTHSPSIHTFPYIFILLSITPNHSSLYHRQPSPPFSNSSPSLSASPLLPPFSNLPQFLPKSCLTLPVPPFFNSFLPPNPHPSFHPSSPIILVSNPSNTSSLIPPFTSPHPFLYCGPLKYIGSSLN